MQKPRSHWAITHRNKHGEVLWADTAHNALTAEGEMAYLSTLFRDTPMEDFYIRLFNDTPTRDDILGNLAGEPSTNGYAAQLIERSVVGWPVLDKTIPVTETGTAQEGGANTIKLAATLNATGDFYTYSNIEITEGTGVGQLREITDYDGVTKQATLDKDWTIIPDDTSVYTVYADYYILSKVVVFSAVGGSWGPVTYAVLSDAATGITGKLLAYFPLTTARTLADGDTLDFSGMIKFR
jgi:hypothetical protein